MRSLVALLALASLVAAGCGSSGIRPQAKPTPLPLELLAEPSAQRTPDVAPGVPITPDTVGQLTLRRILSGHERAVHSLSFSPDGSFLASGAADETVKIWHVETGRELRSLSGGAGFFHWAAFAPDGKHVAAGGRRGLKIWAVESGEEVRVLARQGVAHVTFSPDGATVAAVGGDPECPQASNCLVKFWAANTGEEIQVLRGADEVTSIGFALDGGIFALGDAGGRVQLWEWAAGHLVREIGAHRDGLNSLSLSHDGVTMGTSGRDGTVALWDTATGRNLRSLRLPRQVQVTFSPDGSLLATGGAEDFVRLWDVDTGEELRSMPAHRNAVTGLVFTLDRGLLASAGGDADRTIRLWGVPGSAVSPSATGPVRALVQGHPA